MVASSARGTHHVWSIKDKGAVASHRIRRGDGTKDGMYGCGWGGQRLWTMEREGVWVGWAVDHKSVRQEVRERERERGSD